MIFHTNSKDIQCSKKSLVSYGAGTTGYRNEGGLLSQIQTKIISNWIQDLNLRVKTIKLLEENIHRSFCDFELGIVSDPEIKNIKK